MKIFTEKEFRKSKKSDTIVIYGSGASVNKLTDENKVELAQFDSISFNWFCFSKIPTTFYVVREQANIRMRVHKHSGETIDSFYNILNNEPYIRSILIVHDISSHSHRAHNYAYNIDNFKGKGVIAKDVKLKNHATGAKGFRKRNIFESGVFHGVCTLNNVLHIVINLGYEKIIFVGVDLNNSRYFWLRKRDTRYSVKQKGRKYSSTHVTAFPILNLVRDIKKHHQHIQMYNYQNRRSLLTKILPMWKNS